MNEWISDYLNRQINTLQSVNPQNIANIINTCCNALKNNNRIFVIGNGGSAANASHFAEDLGKGANAAVQNNPLHKSAKNLLGASINRFRVISLCDSVPYITAIGNDYAFDQIFKVQLESLADSGDLLIASSVSGTSPNLVETFKWAKHNGLYTLSITGLKAQNSVQSIYALADLAILINSEEYGIVEDTTMTLFHTTIQYIMEKMQ